MKKIVIVDCISTGTNYVGDVINFGFKPIVLELKPDTSDVEEYNKKMEMEYERVDASFDIIYEQDTYEKTLEIVKKVNPKLVLSGSERGVFLSTKLANDLNLLCNPIENLDAMTLRHEMHNRIAEKGLRYIRGKVVTSVEEAMEFYDSESLGEVVLKPIYSADSANIRICSDRQEMAGQIADFFLEKNFFGNLNDRILVQERIDGEEYIVNTVSCDGLHRVTTIWKYHKIRTSDGAFVYDTVESVNELDVGEAELIDYAYDVCDAVGIKYGPVHGEFMIDDKGPVLIEVNCSVMGGHIDSEFFEKVSGQHETDSSLESYLKTELFLKRRMSPYRLKSYGAFKRFIVPKDILAKSAPINKIGPKLKSFHEIVFEDLIEEEKFYMKTENVDTSCGLVFLTHKKESVLRNDIKFLRSVERNLVLSEELDNHNKFNNSVMIKKLQLLIDAAQKYGKGILITDQTIYDVDIFQIGIEDVSDVEGEFDYVIINLNRSIIEKSDYFKVDFILKLLSYIRVGGYIFIPETTYRFIPGQRKGIELLLKALDLRIEVPPYGPIKGVIASKS